jgi:hypothetical protein
MLGIVFALSLADSVRAQSTRAPDREPLTLVARFGMLGVADAEPADPLAALELRFAQNWRGLHPWVALNLTDSRTWFAGAGLVYHVELSANHRLTLGSGPFYYQHEPDRDLGLDLEFYSFAELTRELPRNQRVGVRIGHLSNAGLGRRNPGSETISIVYTRPLAPRSRWWHARRVAPGTDVFIN